jgi:sugar lactone lactonase YvrE
MSLRRSVSRLALITMLLASGCAADQPEETQPSPVQAYDMADGSRPHDVAPADDGGVWFTGQRAGFLGHFDPSAQTVRQVPLGQGSAPHGVIVGPDGAAWVTDGGLNAIVRVDSTTDEVRSYPLPAGREGANLNTATFDRKGVLWFTGQAGVYGRLDPRTGRMTVYDAPRGPGPYGIATTPDGDVYYASLAGSYVGRINTTTGEATVLEPPTPQQGARRVWSDSAGRIWVSEWNAGQLGFSIRRPRNGASGGCPVGARRRTPCTSTIMIRSGRATLAQTPSCASTRRLRALPRMRCPVLHPMFARFSGARARCGARRPLLISSCSYAAASFAWTSGRLPDALVRACVS